MNDPETHAGSGNSKGGCIAGVVSNSGAPETAIDLVCGETCNSWPPLSD